MKSWTDVRIGDLVLYKNNQLIAFNKPAGMAVQHVPGPEKSLFDLAEIYVKHPLHLIHRLDRPVSGVVLLAQNKNAMASLSRQFAQREVRKVYLAIVPEKPERETGVLRHYLKPARRSNRVIVAEDEGGAPATQPVEGDGWEEAVLRYTWRGSTDNYHLLEIELETGRHHQIRAQLAAMRMPIKGDVKYGFRRGNRDRSIDLHAWKLGFRHPVSREAVELEAPPPTGGVWNAFPEWK